MESADFWIPQLPTYMLSFHEPETLAWDLANAMDGIWNKRMEYGGTYDEVILIGHSVGALLVRKMFVFGRGETPDAPFEVPATAHQPRPASAWTERVTRIVLLAGMNRGWQITHHLTRGSAVLVWTGAVFAAALHLITERRLLIFAVRRGAPFITQLRLQWLAMLRSGDPAGDREPLVVQLLGTVDDLVAPEDNVDLLTGRSFVFFDAPQSGHMSILDMQTATDPAGAEPSAPSLRRNLLKKVLETSPDVLRRESALASELSQYEPKDHVTDVVFVIHGIRDAGYWTQRIARKVKEVAREPREQARVFETETSTYGYFPMLPFLLPWKRRAKVEWLMDEYTENLARYPNARFSYVGHSHGTYLVAKALEEYPACRFRHVVFAGSVVRRAYDWGRFLKSPPGVAPRVEKILNYVATGDWVVAIFPGLFEFLPVQDLGSAGHQGFIAPSSCNIEYVRGQHSAALKEEHWSAIARFIVDGTVPHGPLDRRQSTITRLAGYAAPLVWLSIIALAIAGGFAIVFRLPFGEWQRAVLLIAYVGVLRLVVTRI